MMILHFGHFGHGVGPGFGFKVGVKRFGLLRWKEGESRAGAYTEKNMARNTSVLACKDL